MNIWLLFNFGRKRNRNRNLDNFKKKRGGEREREREANEVIFSAGVEIDIFFFINFTETIQFSEIMTNLCIL